MDDNITNIDSPRTKNLMDAFKKGDDVYGGNQGSLYDLYKKRFKTKTDKYELQLIEDTIRKYYPDMTNSEMEKFLKSIKDRGCTYVATANSIFEQLNYDSKLFKEKFGFDMYLPNGKLNQNQLIADMYASMSQKVKVQLIGTIDSQTYDSCSSAAKKIFGLDLNEHDAMVKLFVDSRNIGYYVKDGGLNPDGTITLTKYTDYSNPDYYVGTPEDIVDRFLGKDIDVNVDNLKNVLKANGINANVTNPPAGAKIYTLTNDEAYLSDYLNSKGMKLIDEEKPHIYKNVSDMIGDLKRLYEDGYSINVMGKSISMTDGSKFGWVTLGPMDGHAMILRGVTDSGDVIVSSWGRYYRIPNDEISNLEFYYTKMGDND